MTAINLKIDQGQIADVNRMLMGMPGAIGKVIQQSVNRTLTGVRTDATNEVANVITPTKTAIRKTMTVKKMNQADGTAYVRCMGAPLNLIEFKARQTQKGVTVQVLKTSPRTLLKHAFIATMKSGKKLVIWRKYDDTRKPWKKTFPYGKLPKAYRLPVRGLTSMAIPDVMGHEPTMNKILDLGNNRLQKNLKDRLNYEVSKL
jgi:hypothetical protein